MPWLVAGLGNPGDRYANTRHNVGRMVTDELARDAGGRFKKARFLPAEVAEIRVAGPGGDERVWLVRSTQFMNESGPSYAGVAKKHGIDPAFVIAVHDELDVAQGELRVKLGGGTAGHNGLRSLQTALRTPEFFRVRLGVGRPPGRQDPADFVLQPIGKRAEADVSELVARGADAVRSLIADGLSVTQDRFNGAAGAR
jgi:PTH1 family peptidyl-tRNA hydrolase